MDKEFEGLKMRLIKYLRKNKVSTTEVADCLGKAGVIEGILPLTPQVYKAGEIKYAYAIQESNWTIHEALIEPCEDKIFFMDAIDVNGRAIIGELVTKFAVLYQEAIAVVTNGKMRDAHAIIKEKFPVWCCGVSPVGCFNRPVDISAFQQIVEERRAIYEGAIAVCDDSGVVLIPKEMITEEFYEKVVAIEQQEDIWFDCIDRLKWNTYDTVCLKKYLEKDK